MPPTSIRRIIPYPVPPQVAGKRPSPRLPLRTKRLSQGRNTGVSSINDLGNPYKFPYLNPTFALRIDFPEKSGVAEPQAGLDSGAMAPAMVRPISGVIAWRIRVPRVFSCHSENAWETAGRQRLSKVNLRAIWLATRW